MKSKILLLPIIICVACGSDKDDPNRSGQDVPPFMGSEEFLEPSDLTQLKPSEILRKLRDSEREFQNSDYKKESKAEVESNSGFEELGEAITKLLLEALHFASPDPETLIIHTNEESVSVLFVNLTSYLKIHCPGADFSHLDGKKGSEVDESQFDLNDPAIGCKGGKRAILSQQASTSEMTTKQGEIETITTKSSKTFIGDEDFSSCELSISDGREIDNCIEIKTETKSVSSEGTTTESIFYYKYERSDVEFVKEETTEQWPKIGTIKFQINNWNGKLTYSAADVSPDYEVSDGKDSFSGKLDEITFTMIRDAEKAEEEQSD